MYESYTRSLATKPIARRKHEKKLIPELIILIGISSSLSAGLTVTSTSVTDDFERTAVASADGTLGTTGAWTNEYADSTWKINRGVVTANLGSNQRVLINKALRTGTRFTLKADVRINYSSGWAGIAFNYQNKDNYDLFRFKSDAKVYQVAKVVNGNPPAVIESGRYDAGFQTTLFYTLTVTTKNGSDYTLDILDATTQSSILDEALMMTDTTFTDGYAGLFQTTSKQNRAKFDNFSLTHTH
jgi:hypothetical protein